MIGIIAIVASLIALVMELQQTQSALSAQTYQERAIDAINELVDVADSEYLAPIMAATDSGQDFEAVANLDAVSLLRLENYLRARMIDWDNEHLQYQQGYMDEDFFNATTRRAVKSWAPRWRNLGLQEGREEFREFVDSVIDQ